MRHLCAFHVMACWASFLPLTAAHWTRDMAPKAIVLLLCGANSILGAQNEATWLRKLEISDCLSEEQAIGAVDKSRPLQISNLPVFILDNLA